jgi:DNA-binding transcriptional ArsR family regulator
MHIYEVMAEPIRRRIVEVLASGEHYAGDLESLIVIEFGVGRSAVQHHLKLLRDHGFVVTRDEWRLRSYRLEDNFVGRLLEPAQHLQRRWDRRIGWSVQTDPLSPKLMPSSRGQRGRGVDPDNPWFYHRQTAERGGGAES